MTLGAMTNSIAKRLIDDGNTSVSRQDIQIAINEAISYYKHKRFWFNERTYNVLLSEGDTQVDLPEDFLLDLPRNTLSIVESGDTYEVRKKPPAVFNSLIYNTGTGRPTIYMLQTGVMSIYPFPDREYTGTLNYIKDYDDFSTSGTADNTTNDFISLAGNLIRNEALSRLHMELRQDEKMASAFSLLAERELSSLMGRTNKLNKTGTLTIQQ